MIEVIHTSFLVCVDEYQIERIRRRRKFFETLLSWTEDDVNFVDETREGEVLSCKLDVICVDF